MDRFPTADEIVQLPCLPLTLALPPLMVAGQAAAASVAEAVPAAEAAHLPAMQEQQQKLQQPILAGGTPVNS